MSESIDGSGRPERSGDDGESPVETALLVFVVLAVLFVVSAAGVALLLL